MFHDGTTSQTLHDTYCMTPLKWRCAFARIDVYFSQVLEYHVFIFLIRTPCFSTNSHTKATKINKEWGSVLGGDSQKIRTTPGEREFGEGALFDARDVSFGQVPWIQKE